MFWLGFLIGLLMMPVATVAAFSLLGWKQIATRFNETRDWTEESDH